MTREAYVIFQTVIQSAWYLFTSWDFPGTHATPAEMGLFLITCYVTLRFFKRIGKVEDSSISDKSQ